MDAKEFERVLKTFADREGDVMREGSRLITDVYGESVIVDLSHRQGTLYCSEEGGPSMPAWRWITQRLGRLDLLARRILDAVEEDDFVIPVEADVIDVLERGSGADREQAGDAVEAVRSLLDDEPAGTTHVVYLTSDAGEGKSSLINKLARTQAQRYLAGETTWLLLPVQLGGRPFLSLDDAIVGTLANRLRFRYYLYASVASLVQIGALVLALDGFEEMFVETRTGEAVSNLGGLLNQFESRGRLLVAARSAYYEYNDFEAQAKLFQSLKDVDVAFSEVSLHRWERPQFLEFASLVGLDDEGEDLYEGLARRIEEGANHPLLTRAVLARKLIENFESSRDRGVLIAELTEATGEQYFDRFVSQLVDREASEKWLYRGTGGGATRPILTVEQHHAILTAVADEMWSSSVDALSPAVLELVAEVVVEAHGLPADVAQQTRIRLPQHALLRRDATADVFRFDHEEFRNYYLGRHLSNLLGSQDQQGLRAFLDTNVLPELTVRVAVERFLRVYDDGEGGADAVLDLLVRTAKGGHRTSYLRSAASQVVLALLSAANGENPTEVAHLYVRAQHAELGRLRAVTFSDSVFERLLYKADRHIGLRFEQCSVLNMVLDEGVRGADASFDDASVPLELSMVSAEEPDETEARRHYDPEAIVAQLKHAGFTVGDSSGEDIPPPPTSDDELVLMDRLLRVFQRRITVSDTMMQNSLGTSWPPARHVLELLIDCGVLEEVQRDSSGNLKWFRMRKSFDELERARRTSRGNHRAFLDALRA